MSITRLLYTTGISLIEAFATHRLIRLYLLIAVIILVPVHACTETKGGSQEAAFKQQPEITEIRPQKPVKIKMKRNTSGQYSWDISGDDTDKVLEADSKLREGLEK